MLIGIDASRALRARRTGTENYSLQLIRHLLALESDHRFRLYCDQQPSPDLFGIAGNTRLSNNAELCVIPFARLWTHLRLSAEVMRNPPDVLFVPSHVLPLIHPRPSVVTVHDLGYHYFPEAHRARDRWYLDLGTRFNARSADRVIADSRATRADLLGLFDLDAEKVPVVYLGRDQNLKPETNSERLQDVKGRLGLRDPYVLTVGTLQPRKNLARLVDAFSRVQARVDAAQLVLAGRVGWLSDPIFEQVKRFGLEDHVLFPGYVEDSDLAALLSGAAAFAFPSLYEGFGFPVLEAQACGTPVLASNTSSLPEVAGDGALFVDPLDVEAIADGLYRLLSDQALRNRLRAEGFANIQRFSWQRCARETLAVLEKVGAA
ncbi:MAG: glycosyltransferase family 1 protein [Chloroflexota bacterium]|nr:glycosyltransferase family 1 protein [Chloroflexota bacterium]